MARTRQGVATMNDVARAAGVSQATVSLVLNDLGGSRVSRQTRDVVLKSAEALGYRTNAAAKTLRGGVSGLIGFIGDVVASAPFAGGVIEGAQERAWEDGMLLLVVNTAGDRELEHAAVEAMLSHSVAGVVYSAMYHRSLVLPDGLSDVPAVVLNSLDAAGRVAAIVPDEVQGGRTATEFLIQNGHRHIGMINIQTLESGLPAAVGRDAGFRQAMAEEGLPVNERWVRFGDGNSEGGFYQAMDVLTLKDRPTALFCGNDRTAWGVYQAAARLGIAIPEQLSVVGFDNQITLAPHLRPPLTTIDLPFHTMGRHAMELLLAGPSHDGGTDLVACNLVERESVAATGDRR